jgi:hypothetical protein
VKEGNNIDTKNSNKGISALPYNRFKRNKGERRVLEGVTAYDTRKGPK